LRSRDDRARATVYVSGRELGDEYRYILERRGAKRFPSVQLDKPGLLLNPWARRATTTDVMTAAGGGGFAAPGMAAYAARGGAAPAPRPQAAVADDAYVGYDFLDGAPAVLANLVPADDGSLAIPLTELGGAISAMIVVDDPRGTTARHVAFAEAPLTTRDRRLRIALDPSTHATQEKRIVPLEPGVRL